MFSAFKITSACDKGKLLHSCTSDFLERAEEGRAGVRESGDFTVNLVVKLRNCHTEWASTVQMNFLLTLFPISRSFFTKTYVGSYKPPSTTY